MSSRLFTEVREKRGLCYYVHADLDQYHDIGVFGASAGVDPKRIDEAITVTLAEFMAVADGSKPVTAAELQRAKDYVAGKLILGLEDSESVAHYYGMKEILLGEIMTPEEVLAEYNKVTIEEVMALAKETIIRDELRFALIGPFEDAERFQKLVQ
jgi:predicted Zn-dependent peptidase